MILMLCPEIQGWLVWKWICYDKIMCVGTIFLNHPVLAEAKVRPHVTAAYNEIKHKQAKVRQLWNIQVNCLQSGVKAKFGGVTKLCKVNHQVL